MLVLGYSVEGLGYSVEGLGYSVETTVDSGWDLRRLFGGGWATATD